MNRGTVETDGLDLNVRTNFAFGALGTLQSQLQLGWVNSYEQDGTEFVGRAGQPEIRAGLTNGWSYGDFQVVLATQYIDGQDNSAGVSGALASYVTHDLQVNYHAPWNGRITVGVDNIGDKLPPLDGGDVSGRGYNVALYDPYGRVPYLRYTQTF